MAATVATRVSYGAGPTQANRTAIRFYNADRSPASPDSSNPCIKPAAGTNYSYWKTIDLYCTAVDGMTDINNVKLYCDASIDWGTCVLYVGDEMTETYDQATGSGDSGDEIVANHSQISAKTDFEGYTAAAPMSITEHSGWATPGANEPITKYVVFQVDIPDDATGGDQTDETLTWQYDET